VSTIDAPAPEAILPICVSTVRAVGIQPRDGDPEELDVTDAGRQRAGIAP
jgi:hypothetical protein